MGDSGGLNALRVGLTGGLASGKSTVARWLAEGGCTVVDADRLVAELYAPGGAGAVAVREIFGPDMLDEDGGVDHARLAERVFSDGEARRRLERAIHPLVRDRFAEIAENAEGIAVLEATLLVEAGHAPDFDLVVTVEADAETRLARAVARGMDESAARARLAAQGDGERRRAAAHRLIRNDGSPAELRAATGSLLTELRRFAERPLPFVLVTGNRHKLAEARRLAGGRLEAVELDLPEIQELDPRAVLTAKGEEAWRRLRRPLVVEETGLELAALNGFPGPLVKWMLAAVGAGGIARAAHALGNDAATARCLLLFRDGERAEIAEGVVPGRLAPSPRGHGGFGWDAVFLPDGGGGATYAELDARDKDALGHRGLAWRALRKRLFLS